MRGIGIDHQRTVSVARLDEGVGFAPAMRTIGDGVYDYLLHAATRDGPWSSQALAEVASLRIPTAQPTAQGSSWSTESQAWFWEGMGRRLATYLGRTLPLDASGYEIVISAMPNSVDRDDLSRVARAAGCGNVSVVDATIALASRWLASADAPNAISHRVVSVVIGDTSAAVGSVEIERDRQSTHFRAVRKPVEIVRVGLAHWIDRLLTDIEDLMPEPPSWPGLGLAMHQAAIEYGARLAEADVRTPIAWNGPLRDRFFRHQTLRHSRRDLLKWQTVAALRSAIPGTIREAIDAFGVDRNRVQVVVGGIGVTWPVVDRGFLEEIHSQSWLGPDPMNDVATGAALWAQACGDDRPTHSDLTARSGSATQTFTSPTEGTRPDGPLVGGSMRQSAKIVSPWNRQVERAQLINDKARGERE